MRCALLLTIALSAGPAFGQGLGLTPALPEGPSALTVTPQAGPWMILVASFGGRPARAQAEELATEIRTRYHLPAYVFNHTAEERRAEQERVAREKSERRKKLEMDGLPADTPIYVKTIRIEDQYAVLVGGYRDDVMARKELDAIRKLTPSKKFASYAYVPDPKTGKFREEAVNPFQSAFICHNPTVRVSKPKQDANMDQRLKQYNANETFSLLHCPKPYTLVVKAYKCTAMLESQNASSSVFQKLSMGRKAGDILNANGNEAHKVAEVLRNRQLGFEAYVLHTEYNSYVTIGGFDSPDDPRLAETMQHFLHELYRPGSGVYGLNIYTHFKTDPMPMPVPHVK
jgi:hypothetical protein